MYKRQLLDSLELKEEAKAIETAVEETIAENYLTQDLNEKDPKTTEEVGKRIVEKILKSK